MEELSGVNLGKSHSLIKYSICSLYMIHIACIIRMYIIHLMVPKMHIRLLKLVYVHNELLHVSASHVSIFRYVK
jgi:hypothetical protein